MESLKRFIEKTVEVILPGLTTIDDGELGLMTDSSLICLAVCTNGIVDGLLNAELAEGQ
jgi:hypothetical protein